MDPRLMIGPESPQLGTRLALNRTKNNSTANNKNFIDLFNRALETPATEPIRISAHASKRLADRNINLDDEMKASLNLTLNELSARGAKDSLIVTKEAAFLVNVPNRTMITAMSIDEMQNGIVTNIDSVSMKNI
jgi:flagellar operon protein